MSLFENLGFVFQFLVFDKWLQALSELHDQIPPFPQTVAMKIIEEELGCPVESVYTNISDKPVAAASFGQVTAQQLSYSFYCKSV